MRPALFALSLLAATLAHAHEDHDHEHGALGAHEHGVAQLDVVLDGDSLQLQLESPAMNIVGFEHAASSDADKATLAEARAQLEKPEALFGLPAAAGFKLADVDLDSPLFGDTEHEHADEDHDHDHEDHDEHEGHQHSDIDAGYSFSCTDADELDAIDFAGFFERFPATHEIRVQAIGPNGQQGGELTPTDARLAF